MLLESPPFAGLLLLGRGLYVPNLKSLRPVVSKISAHFRHYGRFLEKRAGDLVRFALRDRPGSQSRILRGVRPPTASRDVQGKI
jgi:hypothetical protein